MSNDKNKQGGGGNAPRSGVSVVTNIDGFDDKGAVKKAVANGVAGVIAAGVVALVGFAWNKIAEKLTGSSGPVDKSAKEMSPPELIQELKSRGESTCGFAVKELMPGMSKDGFTNLKKNGIDKFAPDSVKAQAEGGE